MRKIVLVGQAPGRKPGGPLLGAAGRRVADLCGLSWADYLIRFERVNLLTEYPGKNGKGDAFPLAEASRSASILKRRFEGRTMILLGQNVARAFGLLIDPLTWTALGRSRVAVLPHPSGINRWYNSPGNRRDAARFMRKVLKLHRLAASTKCGKTQCRMFTFIS